MEWTLLNEPCLTKFLYNREFTSSVSFSLRMLYIQKNTNLPIKIKYTFTHTSYRHLPHTGWYCTEHQYPVTHSCTVWPGHHLYPAGCHQTLHKEKLFIDSLLYHHTKKSHDHTHLGADYMANLSLSWNSVAVIWSVSARGFSMGFPIYWNCHHFVLLNTLSLLHLPPSLPQPELKLSSCNQPLIDPLS